MRDQDQEQEENEEKHQENESDQEDQELKPYQEKVKQFLKVCVEYKVDVYKSIKNLNRILNEINNDFVEDNFFNAPYHIQELENNLSYLLDYVNQSFCMKFALLSAVKDVEEENKKGITHRILNKIQGKFDELSFEVYHLIKTFTTLEANKLDDIIKFEKEINDIKAIINSGFLLHQ